MPLTFRGYSINLSPVLFKEFNRFGRSWFSFVLRTPENEIVWNWFDHGDVYNNYFNLHGSNCNRINVYYIAYFRSGLSNIAFGSWHMDTIRMYIWRTHVVQQYTFHSISSPRLMFTRGIIISSNDVTSEIPTTFLMNDFIVYLLETIHVALYPDRLQYKWGPVLGVSIVW